MSRSSSSRPRRILPPPTTFADFLAYAREHPRKVRYGSAGVDSYQRINTEILAIRAGLDLVHIPFKGGGAEILRDLANGDIHVSWFNTTTRGVTPADACRQLSCTERVFPCPAAFFGRHWRTEGDARRQPILLPTRPVRVAGGEQTGGIFHMARKLTALAVTAFRAKEDRYEVPDGGCRGLYLLVQPSGKRRFCVRYRFKGVSKKLTLDPGLTLAQARAAAAAALLDV